MSPPAYTSDASLQYFENYYCHLSKPPTIHRHLLLLSPKADTHFTIPQTGTEGRSTA